MPEPFAARLFAVVLAATLWAAGAPADETPETILIRRTLGNEHAGRRRADPELALSAYHETFAAFDGHGNGDPRAWTVLMESREALAQRLQQQVATYRYEAERTLPFVHVRAGLAVVTSLDSGQVVQRQTGAAGDVRVRRLWMLRKIEEKWLVTGVVEDLGDTVLPVDSLPATAEEIDRVLARERQAWADDDPGGVSGLFSEHSTGCDGYQTFKPETWKIVFSGAAELATWVDRRMEFTDYQIERQVVHSTVGEQGQVGLAVTREAVATRHLRGDAVHTAQRYVLWTLGREGGEWKVTNVCYNVGLPQ
ncbi:MAG: hypothetical protein AB1505_18105 [Candidatus Latescibacterota bacterium]